MSANGRDEIQSPFHCMEMRMNLPKILRLLGARRWLAVGGLLAVMASVPVVAVAASVSTSTPASASASASASATPAPAAAAAAATPEIAALATKIGVNAKDMASTPIPGVYELLLDGQIGYVSADGRYYLRGELLDMEKRENITDQRTQTLRKEALAAVDPKQMILFPAAHPKYTVTVFTDVDCTYCRKLHSQISAYNDAGITVQYLAFPREGPNTENWAKMQQVWCAKDRRAALTQAKLGKDVGKNCDNAPDITSQYQLGARLGMPGTPGVFAPDGRMLGGYLPPDKLLAELDGSATIGEPVVSERP
jgi:thiol:disulfide interchange protein DsbC